ncbi:transcription antitermination factor NusB [Pseudomonas aeruginosa]|nr:transcription antitermination factor NusB [Pseudomonas aeruginosa]
MSNQDSGNPAAKPPKGKTAARRKARSLAVQALYSWQIAGQPLHEIEAQFRTDNDFSEVDGAYFHEILHGVPRQKSELDSTFEPCLDRPLAEIDPVELAILRLSTYELRNRIDVPYKVVTGKVGIRNVDVGNLVRVGDSLGLFSVTQIAPISVVFSLQQEQLPQLQALLGGEAAVRAYSRDGGSALGEGRLLTIDNQIDSSTGTIRVRASFDNRQARLWPGQFVAVSLHTGVRRDQLVLSSKAVRRGLEGNFVYRVAADRVEAVPVRVLQDIDGLSVVEGLASGDQVVVDGHSRLMPGALVDIQEPRPSLAQVTERRP